MSKRSLLKFFTRTDVKCSLCDRAMSKLKVMQEKYPFDIEKIDIVAKGNEHYYEQFQFDIPVMHMDDKEICRHRVNEEAFKKYFNLSTTINNSDTNNDSETN
ncbi:hypothetical protein ABK040_007511 [Willaertia magna]